MYLTSLSTPWTDFPSAGKPVRLLGRRDARVMSSSSGASGGPGSYGRIGFHPRGTGRRFGGTYERTDMSAGEKARAKAEQVVGKAVRKAAHAMGKETTAAKGAALETRGRARATKEKSRDHFRH
ncbi:hypothetical protein CGZ69_30165 [Streptomyces peucetius subsp. caesius ATCC 27952]|nr:hypothetical protein CGZ69_30165 [Streptomyces peucetius subsp. caesius ATCC 27952]